MRAVLRLLVCLQRRQERPDADDVHNPGQIVGQDVQCHLGGDLGQALHQEVRCSHSHLHRAKGVLHRFSAYPHSLRVVVEAPLNRFQHVLMLPARNPPLLAGRAARLERTVTADIGPVAPELLPVLFVGVVVVQLFASRAAIHILVAEIDKVLFAEAAPCLQT